MGLILLIIVLAVLILSHEFGHFIVAKLSGMRVDEFGLGFPPTLWRKKIRETTYSLNAIPFGGFVKIFGEDAAENPQPGVDYSTSFSARPKYQQALVLVAGVGCNLILAWLLFSVGFMTGLPVSSGFFAGATLPDARLLITNVAPESPAAEAGLPAGSEIVSLTEQGSDLIINQPDVEALQTLIAASGGRPVEVGYIAKPDFKTVDQTQIKKVVITPKDGLVPGKLAIGVSMDMVALVKEPIYKAPITGAIFTAKLTTYTAEALWGFIKQLFSGHSKVALAQVTGPIGLIGLVGEAGRLGFIYLLTFTALISINLAVINLIPFPALDGGRLLFLLIETIKGSPIKPKVANMVNAIGFLLLIGLMIVVTIKDISVLW